MGLFHCLMTDFHAIRLRWQMNTSSMANENVFISKVIRIHSQSNIYYFTKYINNTLPSILIYLAMYINITL